MVAVDTSTEAVGKEAQFFTNMMMQDYDHATLTFKLRCSTSFSSASCSAVFGDELSPYIDQDESLASGEYLSNLHSPLVNLLQ